MTDKTDALVALADKWQALADKPCPVANDYNAGQQWAYAVAQAELREALAAQPAESREEQSSPAGAVAWYVFADTEHWVTLDRDEADDNRFDGHQVRPLIFGDTRPSAAAAVAEYWVAAAEGVIEFGMSTDDGNGGEAARTEVNDWINQQPHPGDFRLIGVAAPAAPKGGVVDEAMVERALDAQPFAEARSSPARVWQLFLDERDAKDIIRAALTAALANQEHRS